MPRRTPRLPAATLAVAGLLLAGCAQQVGAGEPVGGDLDGD